MKGKGERCWPREMSRLEGGAWALRPEEGSVEDLELGCEELGERERKWRKEHGQGEWLWKVCVGIASETAPSMLGREEKQPQEGQWLPSATWKQRTS